jgi:HSP90 family molecular chaperone
VDSEDLPLSLSREKPQNSALLKRIRDVLTRKFLRFLSDEAKNNPEGYREFYLEYHMFLKEGVCQDYAFMEQLSKLLLFDSSAAEAGSVISLDDYISRKSHSVDEIVSIAFSLLPCPVMYRLWEICQTRAVSVSVSA